MDRGRQTPTCPRQREFRSGAVGTCTRSGRSPEDAGCLITAPLMLRGPRSATMTETTTVEAVLKHDRVVVLAGVVGLSALAWAYLFSLVWRMPPQDMPMAMAMAMPHMQAWGTTEVLLTWVMWAVMMVAMMTPSAAPMILTFATIN